MAAEAAPAAVAADEGEEALGPAPPIDEGTKQTVQKIPLLSVRAGPRDGDQWVARLKQELNALIKYIQHNKASDNDWFLLESNKTGTHWKGKCWHVHELVGGVRGRPGWGWGVPYGGLV